MAKILSQERVIEYTVEFKQKVVELTDKLDVNAVDIANVLGLHPMMVYRWRQESREGKFVAQPTRRISMTAEPPDRPQPAKEKSEIKRLQREVADLKKENDFLKKWDRYLKDQKQRGSDS
jgi:transposase